MDGDNARFSQPTKNTVHVNERQPQVIRYFLLAAEGSRLLADGVSMSEITRRLGMHRASVHRTQSAYSGMNSATDSSATI
jgi:hypothetical protein